MSRPVVTMTTDFGLADGYVGCMKGIILGICAEVMIVDISHDIRPQAIRQAAYVLYQAAPCFPLGTVHVVVVDPGVGSERRPIAVQTERAIYVAPDNGVLSLVLGQEPAILTICLEQASGQRSHISATFHGRDIFAPAAARLAAGAELQHLGDTIPPGDLVVLPPCHPKQQPDGTWRGEVLHVDHFGNIITSFRSTSPPFSAPGSELRVEVAGQRIAGLCTTYSDVRPGEMLAYIGSSRHLEIGVRDGNAAACTGLEVGHPVAVTAGSRS